MEKEDFKKNSRNEFKNKWHGKRIYGQFVREMPVQTKTTICAAQEQALRANYIKNKIDKTSENSLCRMCG